MKQVISQWGGGEGEGVWPTSQTHWETSFFAYLCRDTSLICSDSPGLSTPGVLGGVNPQPPLPIYANILPNRKNCFYWPDYSVLCVFLPGNCGPYARLGLLLRLPEQILLQLVRFLCDANTYDFTTKAINHCNYRRRVGGVCILVCRYVVDCSTPPFA